MGRGMAGGLVSIGASHRTERRTAVAYGSQRRFGVWVRRPFDDYALPQREVCGFGYFRQCGNAPAELDQSVGHMQRTGGGVRRLERLWKYGAEHHERAGTVQYGFFVRQD